MIVCPDGLQVNDDCVFPNVIVGVRQEWNITCVLRPVVGTHFIEMRKQKMKENEREKLKSASLWDNGGF